MELVEGMSCDTWIHEAPSRLDPETQYIISLQIALETSKALTYAHRHSILHRDIKPLNIFISKYGIAKVGDFGISRFSDAITREHTVWNFRSPAYSAPEQWEDKKPQRPTDIYQLGCTLYHLFSGRQPFQSDSIAGLISKHLKEVPVSPAIHNPLISDALGNSILKSLEKDPNNRPDLWEIIDVLAKEVQQQYKITLELDRSDDKLIEKVSDITEFNTAPLFEKGFITYNYVDFNEGIAEAIELFMLKDVKITLRAI